MSQQGKPYTPEQKAEIIESLKPFLEMGYSRRKACAFIGFDDTTLSKWVQDNPGLSMKLTGWENTLSSLALANVHKAIKIESETEDAKIDNSWKYLERKEESFKPKSDVTSDDKSMVDGVTVKIVHATQPTSDNDIREESESEDENNT